MDLSQNNQKGIIFDIQRFSTHDGPGIRSTVFFKGCNLRCFWCHNPESYESKPQLLQYLNKCIGCGKCVQLCPNECHLIGDNNTHVINREKCVSCGLCAKRCYSGALVMSGKCQSVDEIMKTVEADIPFYKNSGGGLTCSGGEPMLQYKFVSELLRAAKEKGIHTALDTAGCVPFESYDSVLPYVDLLLIDLKVMDDAIHKKCTGVSNSRILANIEAINANYDNEIWIRIPVIPTVNDNDANMSASAAFLKRLQHVSRVELLPYHNLGVGKYESLGRGIDENAILKPPKKETMEQLAEHFNGLHFDVVVN